MLDSATFPGLTLPVQAAGPLQAVAGGYRVLAGRVALLHPFGDTDFYRHGWSSWSPSGWRRLSGRPLRIEDDPQRLQTADDAANDTPDAHGGSAVGALADSAGNTLLLGALGLGTPRVGADRDRLWADTEADGDGWFLAYGPREQVFAAYAGHVVERFGRSGNRAGGVWSSWYSFYEDVDEARIADAVRDLAGHPFDVVQVDDGWEAAVGDWRAGHAFPSGMAATAERIRESGFRAGLWLAPLIAAPGSEIVRQRPDLLVQADDGRPLVAGTNWGAGYHALDTTRPEAMRHVEEAVHRAVEAGFSYLKLDFLYAGAVAGRRSRDLPREQVYRDALRRIRSAVGDDVYLLGSGAPLLPSVGLLDGARVGPDTAAFWDNAERSGDPSGSGARNAVAASVERAWQRPWFELDPDAVFFRRRRSLLDEEQRQQVQDAATVLGFRSTSDPMAWLAAEERDELDAWLRADETVERTGRWTWRIDGREVDFGPTVRGDGALSPTTIVE